jgi:hypothetical protein
MKILKDENITIIAQELDTECSLIIEIKQQFVTKIITLLKNIYNLRLIYLSTL